MVPHPAEGCCSSVPEIVGGYFQRASMKTQTSSPAEMRFLRVSLKQKYFSTFFASIGSMRVNLFLTVLFL